MLKSCYQLEVPHLDHEALDASVKDGVLVVAALRQHQEIFAGAGRHITVQLQIQIPQAASVQASQSLGLAECISPNGAHGGKSGCRSSERSNPALP